MQLLTPVQQLNVSLRHVHPGEIRNRCEPRWSLTPNRHLHISKLKAYRNGYCSHIPNIRGVWIFGSVPAYFHIYLGYLLPNIVRYTRRSGITLRFYLSVDSAERTGKSQISKLLTGHLLSNIDVKKVGSADISRRD